MGKIVDSDIYGEEVENTFEKFVNLFGVVISMKKTMMAMITMTMRSRFMIFKGIWMLLMTCMASSSKVLGSNFNFIGILCYHLSSGLFSCLENRKYLVM